MYNGTAARPDKYTYTFVLKACTGKLGFWDGEDVYQRVLEDGLERDVFIGTGLIDFWCKMGKVERAREMFDEMRERDVVVWNAIIAGGDPENLLAEGVITRKEDIEAEERKKKMKALEKQYHEELKMELQGMRYSASKPLAQSSDPVAETTDQAPLVSSEYPEEIMAKTTMSRKKRGLYEAIKINKKRKQAAAGGSPHRTCYASSLTFLISGKFEEEDTFENQKSENNEIMINFDCCSVETITDVPEVKSSVRVTLAFCLAVWNVSIVTIKRDDQNGGEEVTQRQEVLVRIILDRLGRRSPGSHDVGSEAGLVQAEIRGSKP
ncbi:Pentatricopeptide repeat-containing protein [Drosera capensis]